MGDTMIQVDRLTKIYPRKIESNNLSKDRLIALDNLCLKEISVRKFRGQTPQFHKIVIKWKKVKMGDENIKETKNTLPGSTLSCNSTRQ